MMTYIGLWGESERGEKPGGGDGGGRDSFRISKCLLGTAFAFNLGGEGGQISKRGGGGVITLGWKRK